MKNFVHSKIRQPQTGPSLLKMSFEAYFNTLYKNLLLSALITLLVFFSFYVPLLVPIQHKGNATTIAMLALIAIIPLLSMMVMIINNNLEAKPAHYGTLLVYSLQRFLSIMGCVVSSSLLPLIIVLLCIITYFFLLSVQTPLIILFLTPSITYLLVALSIVPKLFSVILTLTENMDTNTALETSSAMVKGFFGRSFFYFLFALSVIVFTANIPKMVLFYFPSETNLPGWASFSLSTISILIVAPWIVSLWVVHQKDLYLRYQNLVLSTSKPIKKDEQRYDKKLNPRKDGIDF